MNWILYLFVFYIGGVCMATPTPANVSWATENCIVMTKEAEAGIDGMIAMIGDFIERLVDAHPGFEIRLARFEIEAHAKDESDDKEVVLEVDINDCGSPASQDAILKQSKADQRQDGAYQNEEEEKQKTSSAKENEWEKENGVSKRPVKKPEILALNFDEQGLILLKKLDRKRGKVPLVVYIQQNGERVEHVFLNRK